ncbi:hypothetical protein AO367_1471 [Moraxella catarrhalis]|uniref:Uncharacterized protein n=2 Tax=Moraxella catarrhalis TaxID=480 RepID=A0AB36DNW3_MORCA|nr:hypothetical protein AO380_1186 [Moraxella catarrhalis]OAV25299.1 hypothetical protein AO370_1376 [Moraxella catarrhalis]OAV30021.1 hypothetical protein AO367_1471 [Moraxella catarrhalis]
MINRSAKTVYDINLDDILAKTNKPPLKAVCLLESQQVLEKRLKNKRSNNLVMHLSG